MRSSAELRRMISGQSGRGPMMATRSSPTASLRQSAKSGAADIVARDHVKRPFRIGLRLQRGDRRRHTGLMGSAQEKTEARRQVPVGMLAIEAAGIEHTGQSCAPCAIVLKRGRRCGELQRLPGFLPRIEEAGAHRPVDPPPIVLKAAAQQPEARKRAHAVDPKGGWRPSPARRDCRPSPCHRAPRPIHSADPSTGPFMACTKAAPLPGLEPDQRAHGVVEKARRNSAAC